MRLLAAPLLAPVTCPRPGPALLVAGSAPHTRDWRARRFRAPRTRAVPVKTSAHRSPSQPTRSTRTLQGPLSLAPGCPLTSLPPRPHPSPPTCPGLRSLTHLLFRRTSSLSSHRLTPCLVTHTELGVLRRGHTRNGLSSLPHSFRILPQARPARHGWPLAPARRGNQSGPPRLCPSLDIHLAPSPDIKGASAGGSRLPGAQLPRPGALAGG